MAAWEGLDPPFLALKMERDHNQAMCVTCRNWKRQEHESPPKSPLRNAAMLTLRFESRENCLRLLTCRTVETINLCCLSHWVCGNLLGQQQNLWILPLGKDHNPVLGLFGRVKQEDSMYLLTNSFIDSSFWFILSTYHSPDTVLWATENNSEPESHGQLLQPCSL